MNSCSKTTQHTSHPMAGKQIPTVSNLKPGCVLAGPDRWPRITPYLATLCMMVLAQASKKWQLCKMCHHTMPLLLFLINHFVRVSYGQSSYYLTQGSAHPCGSSICLAECRGSKKIIEFSFFNSAHLHCDKFCYNHVSKAHNTVSVFALSVAWTSNYGTWFEKAYALSAVRILRLRRLQWQRHWPQACSNQQYPTVNSSGSMHIALNFYYKYLERQHMDRWFQCQRVTISSRRCTLILRIGGFY